jgi:peroxiredoxin Q/BCP
MISVDTTEQNRAFAESQHASVPILSDPTRHIANAYGVIPAGLPPDRQMASRWTFYIGPDGRILEIDRDVSIRTAGQDVVRKLEALGIEKVRPVVPRGQLHPDAFR